MEVLNPSLVFDLSGHRHELPATSLVDAMEQLNNLSNQHSVDFGIEKIFSLSEQPENNLTNLKNATFYYSPKRQDVFYSKAVPTYELSSELLNDYQSIIGPVLRLVTRKRPVYIEDSDQDPVSVLHSSFFKKSFITEF